MWTPEFIMNLHDQFHGWMIFILLLNMILHLLKTCPRILHATKSTNYNDFAFLEALLKQNKPKLNSRQTRLKASTELQLLN